MGSAWEEAASWEGRGLLDAGLREVALGPVLRVLCSRAARRTAGGQLSRDSDGDAIWCPFLPDMGPGRTLSSRSQLGVEGEDP